MAGLRHEMAKWRFSLSIFCSIQEQNQPITIRNNTTRSSFTLPEAIGFHAIFCIWLVFLPSVTNSFALSPIFTWMHLKGRRLSYGMASWGRSLFVLIEMPSSCRASGTWQCSWTNNVYPTKSEKFPWIQLDNTDAAHSTTNLLPINRYWRHSVKIESSELMFCCSRRRTMSAGVVPLSVFVPAVNVLPTRHVWMWELETWRCLSVLSAAYEVHLLRRTGRTWVRNKVWITWRWYSIVIAIV